MGAMPFRSLPAAFILTVATSAVCQSTPAARNAVVPLCDLLKDSAKYTGKSVTTAARIFPGRHVTVIWDPACRGLGATLEIEKSRESVAGVQQLEAELYKAGMGDHPVIATLTGTWVGTERTDNGFIAQPRIVFRVTDVSNISRSAKIERF
jgi:hypothetical protein